MIDVRGIPITDPSRLLNVAPIARRLTGLNEIEGFTKFYIGVSVSMDTFKEWSPERIYGFFDGIAKVIHARGTPRH